MKTAVLHRYNETLSGAAFVSYEDVPDPKIERPTDVCYHLEGLTRLDDNHDEAGDTLL